jgi:hypothetical protein
MLGIVCALRTPVIDIFELSGYAKLLAELYGEDQLWTEIAKVWDTLLDVNPATLPWVAALAGGGLPSFQIPRGATKLCREVSRTVQTRAERSRSRK